ncbi:hypothetical protein CPB83DRAFT_776091, partial [Crepidotus variabilis]
SKIIDTIGRQRMAAVVSDSTGNTRSHRKKLVIEIPTIQDLPDIVHFLSRMIGDIVKLPFFKEPILVVRAVIMKLNKSHGGKWDLDEAKKAFGIGRGLEAIGKTRFGTIIFASASVQRNLPAIKHVVRQGRVDFGDHASCFSTHVTRKSSAFEISLRQLVAVGTPAVKALTCLESNEATAGDVYIFWHAVMRATKEVIEDPSNEFPSEVQEQILGILNARHSQVFADGNLSTSADLYLAGAYLNPGT